MRPIGNFFWKFRIHSVAPENSGSIFIKLEIFLFESLIFSLCQLFLGFYNFVRSELEIFLGLGNAELGIVWVFVSVNFFLVDK